jgi:hypothetical protein
MAAYRFFTRFEIWIPTVLTMLTVWILYLPFVLPAFLKGGKAEKGEEGGKRYA